MVLLFHPLTAVILLLLLQCRDLVFAHTIILTRVTTHPSLAIYERSYTQGSLLEQTLRFEKYGESPECWLYRTYKALAVLKRVSVIF